MISRGCTVLLSLYLALAPGCNSDGGNDRKSTAPQPSPMTHQAAASPEPAKPEGAAPTPEASSVACGLLTPEDIEAVQGERSRDAKGSEQTSGPLSVAQCFYATPSFNKSVSLTLTRKNAASAEPGGPKEFWKKQFGSRSDRDKRREKEERERGRDGDRGEGRGGEEKEGEQPAQPVKGVGDEAYWVGNQKVGVLYVLKGERFLRISIGGAEEQKVKIEKMKELARRALKRL